MYNQLPKVSVVIPVFNGERYIAEAIDSILAQTFEDFELIVVNDGSTDDSGAITESFTDPRIRLVDNPENMGITSTRNIGISESCGEYIAILDSDDIAMENRLAEQVKFLDQQPEYAMVASWAQIIRTEGSKQAACEILEYDPNSDLISARLLFGNYFVQSSVMLRKKCLPRPAYRSFDPAEDYDLWVRLAKKHKIGILSAPLVCYRIHNDNVSQKQSAVQDSQVLKIISDQLTALGIFPSEYELDLHRNLNSTNKKVEPKQLHEVEQWLCRLLRQNEKLGVYEPDAFEVIVKKYWKSVCRELCENHPLAFFQCLASKLSDGQRFTFVSRGVQVLWSRVLDVLNLHYK